MAKLTEETRRKLEMNMLYNPPGLIDAAEELDPDFLGGWIIPADKNDADKPGQPGIKGTDDFEFNPPVDYPDYVPPSKQEVYDKWLELYAEYDKKYYQLERKIDYERLEEQIDKLFHDVENGFFGEAAKSGQFFQCINNVKCKWPKE